MRKVERLRGRAGQAQRLRRLQRTKGLCEMCLALGRVTEATIVDHIVPLDHGGCDEDDNTRNLCKPHDIEVTAKQFGHQVATGMRGVSANGRPTGLDHAWNRNGPIRSARAAPRRPTPPGGPK